MPWKNGGGVTTEALVVPLDASLDSFHLRVSMARVESDGPFSALVGIDRTLVVTHGSGLELGREDGSSIRLDGGSEPFRFSGDERIDAKLIAGPVVDLNIMTRRSHASHLARRAVVTSLRPLELSGDLSLFVVLSGAVRLKGAGTELSLRGGDIVTRDSDEGELSACSEGDVAAHLLVVDVSFHPARPR